MTMPAPKDENDPWRIAIKEALEQRGYCASLCTLAFGPTVYFFIGRAEKDGIQLLTGQIGYVYYTDNQWRVFLADENSEKAYHSLDETIAAILEYMAIPTMKEHIG